MTSATLVGEDLVETQSDRARFLRDVGEAVREAFPEGSLDCIEREEGCCHGSDTMIAVLAPWTASRPGPLQRAAAARNLVWSLDTTGAVVGDKDGGLTVSPAVVQLRRYRRPRSSPPHPFISQIVWYTMLCLSVFLFVHFVYLR